MYFQSNPSKDVIVLRLLLDDFLLLQVLKFYRVRFNA